jgi:hypothetical protein
VRVLFLEPPQVLGITLRTVDGKLEISWDGGSATV